MPINTTMHTSIIATMYIPINHLSFTYENIHNNYHFIQFTIIEIFTSLFYGIVFIYFIAYVGNFHGINPYSQNL